MINLLNKLLFYSLLILPIYLFFLTDYNKLIILTIFSIGIISYKFLEKLDDKYKTNLSPYYFFVLLIIFYLNVFGDFFFEFYLNTLWYDKMLHFITPLYLFIFFSNFIKKIYLLILFILSLCVIWELIEFAIERIFLSKGIYLMWTSWDDCVKDMVFNCLGIGIGYLFVRKR